jgi:hypothetical protein
MTGTAYDRIVGLLRDDGRKVSHPREGQARSKCPAHNGTSDDSLAVKRIEGMALIYCHAGCQAVDVLAALELSMRDLYDAPVTDYAYTDPRGAVTRKVHRRYDGPTRRIWQSGDTSATQLYRLPAVIEAVENDVTIYVVEGEKDVHALESLGAVATTNPQGAGKWSKVDPSPLSGGKVVVVADKDGPGRKHAREVLASLDGTVQSIRLVEARTGKDAADHIAAGHSLDDLVSVDLVPEDAGSRTLRLTPASAITMRRVQWLWDTRLAVGILALLAGREGLGKSTFAYWLVARITRGELSGERKGHPRAVLVCATEDSWEHTIVPRLTAAGADLTLVYRIEVVTADDITIGLSLPRDLHEVEQAAIDKGAALLLLDPLMSRISDRIDPHKDLEVRHALEPLTWVANRTRMTILGIIHLNKTGSVDILDRVMGSKAFAAVARAVCAVVPDPDDETSSRRLFGVPKNNLGRSDLPSIRFTIQGTVVETADGPSDVGAVTIGDETQTTIHEAMERNGEDAEVRTQVADAKEWLRGYLTEHSHADSRDVKREGAAQGFSERTIQRARKSLRVVMTNLSTSPRRTVWSLPPSVVPTPWGEGMTDTTDINAGQSPVSDLGGMSIRASRASRDTPARVARLNPCVDCGKPLPAYQVAKRDGRCVSCHYRAGAG